MLGELFRRPAAVSTATVLLAVADRDRTDADDIEFEFFDEPPTIERTRVEEPPPKRGGGPPLRPRAPGRAPLGRLALLIGGAIVLAVVLVFWISSCRSDQKKGAYEDYLQDVGAIAQDSEQVGQQLNELLTTPGATLEDLQTGLDGLAKQQAQLVTRADSLTSPGALVEEQGSLVESMQLFESGLAGLSEAFSRIELASDPDAAGQTLAEQGDRLIAGQVIYDDLFKGRSEQVMKDEGIAGVPVPGLDFLVNPELLTADSLTELVKRAQGGGGEGGEVTGLHGNGIDGVEVTPPAEGQSLSVDEENTIVASDQLAVKVLVTNSGDFQETKVQVTLTIAFPEPIKKQQTIDVIGAGDTKTVTFSSFTNIDFGRPVTLKVAVKPVPGETNTDNNSVEYPVIFTLE
jgi:hypothetical protein